MSAALFVALCVSVVFNLGLAAIYGDYRRRLSIVSTILAQREEEDIDDLLNAVDKDLPN